MCVYVHMCAGLCPWACTWRADVGTCLCHSSYIPLKQHLSLNLGFIFWARLEASNFQCSFSVPPRPEITGIGCMWDLIHGCWELNPGPHGCTASRLNSWANIFTLRERFEKKSHLDPNYLLTFRIRIIISYILYRCFKYLNAELVRFVGSFTWRNYFMI